MKLSQKKTTELYKAISEPIFQLRVQVARMGPGDKKLIEIDEKLFKLEHAIWHNIVQAMKIEKQ